MGHLAFGSGLVRLRSASGLALLARGSGSVSRAFSGIVVVSGGSMGGGDISKLLGQTAPHDLRILGVFVASV